MVDMNDVREYFDEELKSAQYAVERAEEMAMNTRRQAPKTTLAVARGRLELLENIIKELFDN